MYQEGVYGKDRPWEENVGHTQLNAQLVKEYEDRAKASGAYASPRSMRESARPPNRFADATSNLPKPKNQEAVNIDLTEPQDPFSILMSADKKDLTSTVG